MAWFALGQSLFFQVTKLTRDLCVNTASNISFPSLFDDDALVPNSVTNNLLRVNAKCLAIFFAGC